MESRGDDGEGRVQGENMVWRGKKVNNEERERGVEGRKERKKE